MTSLPTTPATAALGLLPPGLDLSPSKQRLYEVAMRLFAERGYHAVGLRDVADELGQQPSSIYFHVDSKLDLLFELCVIGHQAHLESLRNALMDAGRDPWDQLRAVIGAHVAVHLDYPAMARLTNRELRALSEEQLAHVMTIRNPAEQVTVDVIERGVRMGEFRVEDPLLTTRAIHAMALRLPEWWNPETDPRTREHILAYYVDLAVRMVR